MSVRTKRLFGPLTTTAVVSIVYTCPAGKTALFKLFTFSDQGAVGPVVRFFLNGTGVPERILRIPVDATASTVFSDTFVVLHPGDVLRAQNSIASSVTVCGFGAELEGVAP